MKSPSIAILVFGEPGSERNALTEEKYSGLARGFMEKGFSVESVLFHNKGAERLSEEMLRYNALLVWVNPVEKDGQTREKLDTLLSEISSKGIFVSAHPEVILKIGTKEILYKARNLEFGSEVKIYPHFDDFRARFLKENEKSQIRILKQYRGNGGDGVFKTDLSQATRGKISITSARGNNEAMQLGEQEFFEEMKKYFTGNGMLIDQPWNQGIKNGMVRCYLTGTRVSGFGYQEINALYPLSGPDGKTRLPGRRYYFSEQCGLFADLKHIMETRWVAQLMEIASVSDEMMPVIWDADFFINKINTERPQEKYTLCEINVSCVSPFPESAIPFIVEETGKRIAAGQ